MYYVCLVRAKQVVGIEQLSLGTSRPGRVISTVLLAHGAWDTEVFHCLTSVRVHILEGWCTLKFLLHIRLFQYEIISVSKDSWEHHL